MLEYNDKRYKEQLIYTESTNVMLEYMMRGECHGMILGSNKMVYWQIYKGNDNLKDKKLINDSENICDKIQLTTKK